MTAMHQKGNFLQVYPPTSQCPISMHHTHVLPVLPDSFIPSAAAVFAVCDSLSYTVARNLEIAQLSPTQ